MNPEVKEFLDEMVITNLRGVRTSDLVCDLQHLASLDVEATSEDWLYLMNKHIAHITKELERRKNMPLYGNTLNDPQIFNTIKEKAGAEGLVWIISSRTQVFVDKKTWQFRCPFGEDKHPSGVIYKNELRWWCFRCNHGGDVFDALIIFERQTLSQAIQTLARYTGIDIKPAQPPKAKDSPKRGYQGLKVGS